MSNISIHTPLLYSLSILLQYLGVICDPYFVVIFGNLLIVSNWFFPHFLFYLPLPSIKVSKLFMLQNLSHVKINNQLEVILLSLFGNQNWSFHKASTLQLHLINQQLKEMELVERTNLSLFNLFPNDIPTAF